METFFLQKGLNTFVVEAAAFVRWRIRAKLAVQGSWQNPQIGLYKQNSHEVVAIPHCQIHHPAINRAVQFIKEFITEEKLQPYQEKSGQGDLRYLQLTVEPQTSKVQVVWVVNQAPGKASFWKEKLRPLWELHAHLWHSFWINENNGRNNVILSSHWGHLWGEESLWISLRKRAICFHPGSFIQANLSCFEKLLEDLAHLIPRKSSLLEYYAGVGVIGLTLLDRCDKILCCEINPQGKWSFEQSFAQLQDTEKVRISYQVGDAKQLLALLEKSQCVFVDPPRKGLDPAFIQAVDHSSCSRFIYMSCGWKSFQRDCDHLLALGWQLSFAKGYLFFPGSDHLEVLACFERKAS